MKRQIKVTPNYSKRTFTIRSIYYGQKLNNIYKISTDKFRTLPFDKDTFDDYIFNTSNDWQQFLRYNDGSYYAVKQYQ